jgi:hypothetical protein
MPAMMIIGFNSAFLFYGSYTFTEAFMMLMEASSFYFFLRHIRQLQVHPDLKSSWKSWLLFGLFLFLLSITKNIALITIVAAIAYFLIYLEWKNALLTIASFLVFKLPYELFTKVVMHDKVTGQLDQQMRVDFYDASKGYEDLGGYVNRFFTNADRFIGEHFFRILGLRPGITIDSQTGQPQPAQNTTIFLLIFAALAVFAFVVLWRRNRFATFSLIFGITLPAVSFIALQTMWNDQDRLLIPYIPYLLIPILTAAYLKIQTSKQIFLKPIFVGFLLLMVILQFPRTMDAVSKNSRGLKHYRKGDMTYGLQPNYAEYINAAQWAATHLPPTARIACGQPSEAFVYSNYNNFVRIGRPVKGESVDSTLSHLKAQGITHLLLANVNGSSVPATFRAIQEKRPQALKLVYQTGEDQQTVADVIEIQY